MFLIFGVTGSGWVTFATQGVQVTHPAGWHVTTRQVTPVTYPKQVLAVASFPFPKDPRANGCRPSGTLAMRQPDGALVYLIEYGKDPRLHFPKRPEHFELRGLRNYECFGRSYQVEFREAGRFFQVFVAFGRNTGPSTRRAVLRILDSVQVRRK